MKMQTQLSQVSHKPAALKTVWMGVYTVMIHVNMTVRLYADIIATLLQIKAIELSIDY